MNLDLEAHPLYLEYLFYHVFFMLMLYYSLFLTLVIFVSNNIVRIEEIRSFLTTHLFIFSYRRAPLPYGTYAANVRSHAIADASRKAAGAAAHQEEEGASESGPALSVDRQRRGAQRETDKIRRDGIGARKGVPAQLTGSGFGRLLELEVCCEC